MNEWYVGLKGHQFDLEVLSEQLSSPDATVFEEEGKYYLKSEKFNSLIDPSDALSAAAQVLELANGAAKDYSGSFQNIQVNNSIYEIDENGKRKHYALLAGIVEARSRVSGSLTVSTSNGIEKAPEGPTKVESLVEIAMRDESIAEHFIFSLLN